MTRERAKELLPVIQAFAEGKKVQQSGNLEDWHDVCESPDFESEYRHFRIKPEPRRFWLTNSPCGLWHCFTSKDLAMDYALRSVGEVIEVVEVMEE